MKIIPKIRSKGKSKRNRCKGRTTETFNNKLAKLQSRYRHSFKTSQASQVIYLALPEADRKPQNKVFFFQKYPDFQKFLVINQLRPIGNETPKVKKMFSKPNKTQIWGK